MSNKEIAIVVGVIAFMTMLTDSLNTEAAPA